MKKIMFVLALSLSFAANCVLAEDMQKSHEAVKLSQPALWDSQFAALKSRIENLERESAKLQQSSRFQDEKIRNLERAVDDIKRRQLR